MVISKPDSTPNGTAASTADAAAAGLDAGANSMAHRSGIPQDQIDNIMSSIAHTGNVKMNNHRKKLRQRFDIIKKLGQGTYGKVQLGINKETGQEVAIKTIKKCKIEAEADLVRIRREVQIMSSVQHPNIIHIYEVFENREKMVLVMEFAAGGELYDYLSERKVLSEEEARRIFRQVATAVYYCHKHKICHRDLKLENILLDEHGNAKLSFDLSSFHAFLAGGEAALMPSPTRTITPAQSPVQAKRKLQPTVSTENAAGTTAKKKEKPANSSFVISEATVPSLAPPTPTAPLAQATPPLTAPQPMETENVAPPAEEQPASSTAPGYSPQDMQKVGNLCEQLIGEPAAPPATAVPRQPTRAKLDAVVEAPEEKDATKVIKKFVNKHKTADLVNAINESATGKATPSGNAAPQTQPPAAPFVRKCSLQDESTLNKFNAERRKSRILETAEKFQPPPVTVAPEKPKKLSIPGVSVGSFKKEFERKATNPTPMSGPTPGERRAQEQVAAAAAAAAAQEAEAQEALGTPPASPAASGALEGSDSKNSVASISLEEARRSMENSIALLRQAQNESNKELDQLCAQTETIGVSEPTAEERERKLKNARAIIGNAIQPASPGGDASAGGAVKTSTASITLKSATLPRRKINAKSEVQLDIKPRVPEHPQPAMRFSTEMQHPVADLRSAPPREGPMPYSPIKTTLQSRATSLEPKEHIITIQRPPTQQAYGRTNSNTTTRSGSLSRQSTAESEAESTATLSQSTVTGGPGISQPIKKSPREFIIPIAVEGGGFITPRERSIEPSESGQTTTSSRSTFSRLRPAHRIGSLLSETAFDESSPFQKMRTASITRDGADEDSLFTPHRLRSSRPVKKISQDNDSQSSGEEDDEDGFEILTAENLFSTLLQRVRTLTNRMNVNSDLTAGFPSHSSRLLTDISRQAQGHRPFWSQSGPFGSEHRSQVSYSYTQTVEKKQVRLNSASNSSGLGAPWRHSMSRDLGSDMESMFSRTGATLPRGHHSKSSSSKAKAGPGSAENGKEGAAEANAEEPLDLADLDLSRLRLSKKDLETLSSITPGLPKCFQEQLLAKLPPTQARKLSRTLSVQSGAATTPAIKVYKRSQSSGRGYIAEQPEEDAKGKPLTDAPKTTSASTAIYRRSLSRAPSQGPAQETTAAAVAAKSRSSSVCRDDYGKSSLCSSSYTSDINDKYKYYSPYLSKSGNAAALTKEVPEKRYSAAVGRPPSGYLSPPPQTPSVAVAVAVTDGSSSLRRRSSQRRISRFLRPDFFDEPRERDSQSVLREIREKSCDRFEATATSAAAAADLRQRKHSLPNVESEVEPSQTAKRHARNKSMEQFSDAVAEPQPVAQQSEKRRGQSRSREMDTELDKHELANKILQELQLLSAVRTQKENDQRSTSEQTTVETSRANRTEETSTIKKVKKIKSKEKDTELSAEADAGKSITTTTTATTSQLVRKVKRVVKKSTDESSVSQLSAETQLNEQAAPMDTKIKRPKSYPMKDLGLSLKGNSEIPLPQTSATTVQSKLPSKIATTATETSPDAPRESRLMRPKSYPATKLAMPKDIRKVTRSGAAIPSIAETALAPTSASSTKATSEEKSAANAGLMSTMSEKDTGASSGEPRSTSTKKVIKVSKKSKLVPPTPVTPSTPTTTTTTTATTSANSSKESSPAIKSKEKSPEKKPSKGLLYAIGQKFEKLRDSAMSKEKKGSIPSSTLNCAQKQDWTEERSSPEKSASTLQRKKKSVDTEKSQETATDEKRVDKRSRFDTMLRSLRERSVPRTQPAACASPKRSASVEELHVDSHSGGGKQSGAVNKMLGGLLRRFDRESSEQRRVRSTRSSSNIERQVREEQDKSLPTSPIYQNVSKTKNAAPEENCNCETICPECIQNQGATEASSAATTTTQTGSNAQSNKEKRKGLMLDLSNATSGSISGPTTSTATTTTNTSGSYRGAKTNPALINGNGLYSNLPPYPGAMKSASSNNSSSQQSMDNATNNNSVNTNNNCSSQTSGYRTSSAHEINRNNLLTPSFENIANYSSDSRSYQDDCASTSTFMSPTEEPELYFDNWSVCSEDNYMLHATPSPTVSRLSRTSQLSSPTRCSESSDPNESVIDRIKRRSFYSRFNEQKPRRTSSIVGPSAVRDYYREQQAAVKARSSQKLHAAEVETRGHSPDITQQFFRPLKLSPVGTELKPPVYRSPLDYSASASAGATSKPRKSLNDIRNTSPSFLSKRYESQDYSSVPMRYKSSSSSSPSNTAVGGINGYYNTYNPKRRSSYTLNGTLPSGTSSSAGASASSHLDGYATLGRRSIRPYDHRTMSLLEPPTSGSSTAGTYHRREARTPVRDYTSSISRSGSRYRTSSATRSPTNI
ncbi:mucin-5AC [Drosophila navojoa]|uniref:mucin-5AC n=1 Tax=Drosophila navojoa TaxID=7232 RepID=UPI0011BD6DF6|nr:mucin-5AC [Drosophila navojoa]